MEACRLFLDLNGYTMLIDFEVVNVAIQVASNEMDIEPFTEWLGKEQAFLG